jgi:ubiquinone/menaquinone biosynthesis C-methylase UbiE
VLELARTQELVLRHLPPPPRSVLDVGGGTGVYSFWLAERGYEVHFLDMVPGQVDQVRRNGQRLASVTLGDARRLLQADDSVDAVLLLGPMYHLTQREERLRALSESKRVLRRGGVLFAAAISRFASLMDGLFRGFADDPRFALLLEQDLASGQHRNATNNPDYFTTAYFHHPNELGEEIAAAGLSLIELAAVEGPGWLAKDFAERWADPRRRAQLLQLIGKVEHEPALLGMSHHLLAVAKRG